MTKSSIRCKWSLIVFALICAGCQGHLNISPGDRNSVETKLTGKSFWLAQSVYTGPFYDDDRYQLAHPRKFEELTYLKAPDGETIYPPQSTGVLPVGTKMKVLRIDWPTGWSVAKRPLYTPRYSTWVVVEAAGQRLPLVLLPPAGLDSEKAYLTWLSTLLSEKDMHAWLSERSADVQQAIRAKRPLVGMRGDELMAAMGSPDRIERTAEGEKATYGEQWVTLQQNVVVAIHN